MFRADDKESLEGRGSPAHADDRQSGSCCDDDFGSREGTKIAHVIAMLRREQGAKLDDLVAATGWSPYTARRRG